MERELPPRSRIKGIGVAPNVPVTRDALYLGIREGREDTLRAVRPGNRRAGAEGNLQWVILERREVTNDWWLSARRHPARRWGEKELSGVGVLVLAGEDAGGIEGLGAMVQTEEEFQKLAGDRGHGDGTAHAGSFFCVIVRAVEAGAHDEFEHCLCEDGPEPGAAPFCLAFLAPVLATLLGPQVHARVAQQLRDRREIVHRSGFREDAREQKWSDQLGVRVEFDFPFVLQRGEQPDHLRAQALTLLLGGRELGEGVAQLLDLDRAP